MPSARAAPAEVAIDNSGGPADGDIYVTDTFDSGVEIFARNGAPLGSLNGPTNPNFAYRGLRRRRGPIKRRPLRRRRLRRGDVCRYSAAAAAPSAAPITDADYSGGITPPDLPCEVAADDGKVYAAN